MIESRKVPAESSARRFGVAAALAAAAVFTSPAAYAVDETPGMRVFKDPETGLLRAPTAAEAAALDAASNSMRAVRQAPRGLLTGKVSPGSVTYADGTVSQELDEASLSYTVLKRNPDGTTETVCVTGTDAANAVMKNRKSAGKVAKGSKEHNHDQK